MDLNAVADLSRIQRVVLLVDLHPLLHRRRSRADDYLSPLLAAARRISSSFSGSAADAGAAVATPLFAYKFFFSSLSPILSSSAVHRLLGKSPTFLSFDRPAPTLASLSRSLSSLAASGALADPRDGDDHGGTGNSPRASLLARSLLQLEHEYGWELAQETPKGRPEMLATRSNLVLLFSPVPKGSNFLSEFIELDAGSDGKSQDAVLDVFLEKFVGTFNLVKERFVSRDIQLGWVDVNAIDDTVCREQEALSSNLFVKGIEELGWGYLSTDAIVLGSAIVPSALILPYVACSMRFKSDAVVKKGMVELFLEITDVNGKPLECKSCDLELFDVNYLIGTLSVTSSIKNTLDGGISKMRVRKIWSKNEGKKLLSNACGFLLLQGTVRGLRGDRVDCHEEEFLADKILKLCCGDKDEFLEGRPIWQLLLSFLYKGNFWASISVDDDDGDVVEGILLPFTVNYALLAVLAKNSSCCSITRKNNSSIEKFNVREKKEGRRQKHSVHASQFQTMTWRSLRESLLTCSDNNDLQVDLEDLYFSRKSKQKKKLKFLKCWMSQVTKCSGGSCMVADEATVHCDVKEGTQPRLVDLQENPEADVISSSAEACPSGSMNDEALPLFPLEDPDSFLLLIPTKIEQGLGSGDADLGILAERLVILSIQALNIMFGRKGNETTNEEEEDDPNAKIAAEVSSLLLRKPKDLIAKYKTTNPTTVASNPSSVTYDTEYKIREFELQILFRMEILKSRIRSNIDENAKLKMVKDICSLLQFIDINLQGDSFNSRGIVEFAEKIIKLRYSQSLRDVICEIYRRMEFDLFDEDEAEVSESVANSNSSELKDENNVADGASGSQDFQCRDESSQTQQDIMDNAHEQRLMEAQERRNRNRRFSSFTSWMPDLQRVWALKQPKVEKRTRDPASKQSKRRRKRVSTSDTVHETPMPSRTDHSNSSSFGQESGTCSGTSHCKSLSKALF